MNKIVLKYKFYTKSTRNQQMTVQDMLKHVMAQKNQFYETLP